MARFRENIRRAIAAGLPADAALAALTRDAAEILSVAPQIGRITKGRAAHLIVCDGDFDAVATKYKFAFADGIRFDLDEKAAPPTGAGDPAVPVGPRRGPRPSITDPDAPAPTTPSATALTRSSTPFVGNAFRSLVPFLDVVEAPITEVGADRIPKIKTGGDVLIRGATVLTGAGKTLPKTDVLIRGGKITAIGSDSKVPDGVTVIGADGMFAMAGIIDTHSHFAISGGVNEASLSVVPEVRVRDALDSEDVQIYRAAAGGVTTARLFHGSADVIGGQGAALKMKYGRPAKELLVSDAPRGVKFALGENVKRTDGRIPNSRLGGEAVLVRAFTEAKTYKKKWADYDAVKAVPNRFPNPAAISDWRRSPKCSPASCACIRTATARTRF